MIVNKKKQYCLFAFIVIIFIPAVDKRGLPKSRRYQGHTYSRQHVHEREPTLLIWINEREIVGNAVL